MKITKAILLAGGSGTRLRPMTHIINKHLLNVYDKPMIYYPLSALMLGGIKDILLITNPSDIDSFKYLLGDGSRFGINISYESQESPGGLPEAFIIGEKFIGNDPISLNLGDHILFGSGLSLILENTFSNFETSTVFSQTTSNPQDYGVISFDKENNPIEIIEKPTKPNSNLIVTGIYAYTNDVVEKSKDLKKSSRNEIEITDLNNSYLASNNLKINYLGRGITWFDAGSPNRILEISNFISLIEKNQANIIGCLEEIALRKNYINTSQFIQSIDFYKGSSYSKYLQSIID